MYRPTPLLLLALGAACAEPPSAVCEIGTERCACTEGGGCDPGLTCLSNHCVDATGVDFLDGGDAALPPDAAPPHHDAAQPDATGLDRPAPGDAAPLVDAARPDAAAPDHYTIADAAVPDMTSPDRATPDHLTQADQGVDASVDCDDQCAELLYTECTCGPTDPCGWIGDDYCDLAPPDERCSLFPEHFDDSEDCAASACTEVDVRYAPDDPPYILYDPWFSQDFYISMHTADRDSLRFDYVAEGRSTLAPGVNAIDVRPGGLEALGIVDFSWAVESGNPLPAYLGEVVITLPSRPLEMSRFQMDVEFRPRDDEGEFDMSGDCVSVALDFSAYVGDRGCLHFLEMGYGDTICGVSTEQPPRYTIYLCDYESGWDDPLVREQECSATGLTCDPADNAAYAARCE